ncbi:DUF4192 domain-containing protein [Aquipuribacter nitratireducens]|uniref:DUF4192 domain-containing protein n=1 Tax=Aquipuribacter nitratireducens TaxID=650104 RepID=A0ABW0GJB4_9MICO
MADDDSTDPHTSGRTSGGDHGDPTDGPVRITRPDGLVAAIPYLLGHRPTRSLVAVGLHGREVRLAARVDLAVGGPPGTPAPGWPHLAGVLVRNRCTAVLVAVYADDDAEEVARRDAGALDALAETVRSGLRSVAGAPDLLDLVHVGPTRYRSLLCDDAACCPPGGRDTDGLASHPVAAAFVVGGRTFAADRSAVEPEPDPASPVDLATAAAAHRRAVRAQRSRPGGAGPDPVGRAELLEEWLGHLPAPPPPESTGRLVGAWRVDRGLRDACLTALTPAGPGGARDLLAGRDTHHVLDRAAHLGTTGLDAAGVVLRRMASLSAPLGRAVVLAGHAWLAWTAGDGTRALVLAERALRDDPRQSLAALVLQCLDHGLGPHPVTDHETDPAVPPGVEPGRASVPSAGEARQAGCGLDGSAA